MNNDSSAIMVLCSHICADGCRPLEPSEWSRIADKLIEKKLRPSDIAELSDIELKERLGFDDAQTERIKRLLERSGSIAFEMEKYAAMGIGFVTRADKEYPNTVKKTLKGACPPIFCYSGDLSLTLGRYIGYAGSRTVSQDDIDFTADTVNKTSSLGYGVVSGGAKGVDSVSAETALKNGAPCIEYLSDSLTRRIKKKEVISAVRDGKLLLLSAMKPDAGFNVGAAMSRNRYIYIQSRATVIVRSELEKGGTWSGAAEALKKGYSPVLCRNDERYAGNIELIRLGAVPIDESWNGDPDSLKPDVPEMPEETESTAASEALPEQKRRGRKKKSDCPEQLTFF